MRGLWRLHHLILLRGEESEPALPFLGGDTSNIYCWFLIGVGGAGINVVTQFLSQARVPGLTPMSMSGINMRGLAGFALLTTNIMELLKPETAQILGADAPTGELGAEKKSTHVKLAEKHIIGHKLHRWMGSGANPNLARAWAEKDDLLTAHGGKLDEATDPEGLWRQAQGFILVHGVGKGTGCGATPVIAKRIKKELKGSPAVFSLTILPQLPKHGYRVQVAAEREITNALIGLADIVKAVDGVFICENAHLAMHIAQESLPRSADFYRRLNQPIIELLNTLFISKVHVETGVQTDIMDIQQHCRVSSPEPDMGSIQVPCHWVTSAPTDLSIMVRNALSDPAKMAPCDERTASDVYLMEVLPRSYHHIGWEHYLSALEVLREVLETGEIESPALSPPSVALAETEDSRTLILLANPRILELVEALKIACSYAFGRKRSPVYREMLEEREDILRKIFRMCDLEEEFDEIWGQRGAKVMR